MTVLMAWIQVGEYKEKIPEQRDIRSPAEGKSRRPRWFTDVLLGLKMAGEREVWGCQDEALLRRLTVCISNQTLYVM